MGEWEGRLEKQACKRLVRTLTAVGNNFKQENDMTGLVLSKDHPSFSVENQLKEDWRDCRHSQDRDAAAASAGVAENTA